MEGAYNEIYQIFIENPHKSRFIRKNEFYERVFEQYSKIFSKKLLDFLLEKMSQGEFRACSLFYDLLKARGIIVPIEVLCIHTHNYTKSDDAFYK